MRWRASLLGLLFIGGVAFADPPAPAAPKPPAQPAPPLSPEKAADAVIAAVGAKDEAALRALGERDEPDPWIVVDELVARGEIDAAAAFAKGASRADVEGLATYVDSRRSKPDDSEVRASLRAAAAALAARKPKDALDALAAVAKEADGVPAARRSSARAIALIGTGDRVAAAAAYRAAGDAARAIGWLRRESDAATQEYDLANERRDFDVAYAVAERRLPLAQRRGDRVGAAEALRSLAVVHYYRDEFAKALPLLRQSVEMRRAIGEPRGLAATLDVLGAVLYATGGRKEAVAIFEEALAQWEKTGDRAQVARASRNLGTFLAKQGDYAKAVTILTRSAALLEELNDPVSAAFAYQAIASAHAETGNPAEGVRWAERAQRVGEAAHNDELVAQSLATLGNCRLYLDDVPAARALFQRAIVLRDRRGERLQVAHLTGLIGVTYLQAGQFREAVGPLEKALEAQVALGDVGGEATTLANLANAQSSLGAYPAAIAAYERVIALDQASGDRRGEATARLNLGAIYHSLGDEARALDCHDEARRLAVEIGDLLLEGEAIANLGVVRGAMGQTDEAIALDRRALEIAERIGSRSGLVHALRTLAVALEGRGASAEARPLLARALAIAREIADRSSVASLLSKLARDHERRSEHADALAAYREAQTEAEASGDAEIVVEALVGSTRTLILSGNLRGGLASAREALARQGDLVGGLSDEQAATARRRGNDVFVFGLVAAARLGDVEEASFLLESGRAIGLIEALGAKGALREAVLPPPLLEAEQGARERLTAALAAERRGAAKSTAAEADRRRAAVAAARANLRTVAERIEREAKAAAGVVSPKVAPLGAIRAALRPDEAMVSYALFEPTAHALVTTAAGARLVPLGPPAAIEQACRALDGASVGAAEETALATLRERVVAPLGLDASVRRVLVSPDGSLGYVPFGPLVGDREVALIPSGTVYLLLADERPKQGTGVLALGDPDYASASKAGGPGGPRAALAGLRLDRLPGSRDEAKAVGDVTLLGRQANVPALREALAKRPRWRAVHFACHGLVDVERPALSSLALSPTETHDGFLTAFDVFRTGIPADLAVLSACETGRGKVFLGEGILGLTRAFMFAGPPRVIVSLWKVDDRATRVLMEAFYEGWNKRGLGAAAALRDAQRRVREFEEKAIDPDASRRAGRDVMGTRRPFLAPRFWAGWSLWGLAE